MIYTITLFVLAVMIASPNLDWAREWIDAFHNSRETPVHVVVLSDSTAHVDQTNGVGYGPDKRANLWPYQLHFALAQHSPGQSHGTGLLTLEANAGRFDTDVWQVSQAYAYNSAIGPFQPNVGTIPANGGTVQMKAHTEAKLASQEGDALWIYWASCPNSTAFTVEVDGKTTGAFGSERASRCEAKRTCVFRGALGEHTATINTGDGDAYLYAAEWTIGNAGIAVDNLAVGGATTTFFNNSGKLAFAQKIPDIGLVIIALGINDFAHDIPLAAYQSGLAAILSDFQQNSPKASILVVSQYQVLSDTMRNSLGLSQAQYNNVARQTAAKYQVGYLDLNSIWKSFSVVKQKGILTTDKVHPSDAGGQEISRQIEKVILDDPGLIPRAK